MQKPCVYANVLPCTPGLPLADSAMTEPPSGNLHALRIHEMWRLQPQAIFNEYPAYTALPTRAL